MADGDSHRLASGPIGRIAPAEPVGSPPAQPVQYPAFRFSRVKPPLPLEHSGRALPVALLHSVKPRQARSVDLRVVRSLGSARRRRHHPQGHRFVNAEFVGPRRRFWMKRVAGAITRVERSRLSARIGLNLALSRP